MSARSGSIVSRPISGKGGAIASGTTLLGAGIDCPVAEDKGKAVPNTATARAAGLLYWRFKLIVRLFVGAAVCPRHKKLFIVRLGGRRRPPRISVGHVSGRRAENMVSAGHRSVQCSICAAPIGEASMLFCKVRLLAEGQIPMA